MFSERLIVRSIDSLLVLLCSTMEPWELFNDWEEWTIRWSLSLSDFKAHISFWNKHMGRVKQIWYLLPMRAAKVQASLRIRAVWPEPPLLAHTSSEWRGTFRQKARSQGPLNGWACAVKICHDGMLEDTNSLDAPHIQSQYSWTWVYCKNPKNSDIRNICGKHSKLEQGGFTVMCPKDAYSVDPDQTAPRNVKQCRPWSEQSDLECQTV